MQFAPQITCCGISRKDSKEPNGVQLVVERRILVMLPTVRQQDTREPGHLSKAIVIEELVYPGLREEVRCAEAQRGCSLCNRNGSGAVQG